MNINHIIHGNVCEEVEAADVEVLDVSSVEALLRRLGC